MAFEHLLGTRECNFGLSIVIGDDNVPGITNLMSSTGWIQICHSKFGSIWVSDTVTSVSSGTRDRVSSLAARLSAAVIATSSINAETRLTIPVPTDLESLSSRRQKNSEYFESMTSQFLMPFLRYVETDSLAIKRDMLCETPLCEKFGVRTFFESCATTILTASVPGGGSLAPDKAFILYKRFIESTTFHDWVLARQESANVESMIAHAKILGENFQKSPAMMARIESLMMMMDSPVACVKHRHAISNAIEELIHVLHS